MTQNKVQAPAKDAASTVAVDQKLEDVVPPEFRRVVILIKAAASNPALAVMLIGTLFGWWLVARAQDIAVWVKPQAEQVVSTHIKTINKLTDDVTEIRTDLSEHKALLHEIRKAVVKPNGVAATPSKTPPEELGN